MTVLLFWKHASSLVQLIKGRCSPRQCQACVYPPWPATTSVYSAKMTNIVVGGGEGWLVGGESFVLVGPEPFVLVGPGSFVLVFVLVLLVVVSAVVKSQRVASQALRWLTMLFDSEASTDSASTGSETYMKLLVMVE